MRFKDAGGKTAAVGHFYEEKGALPASLRAAGFMSSSRLLRSIDMSGKGVIRMQLAFAPLQGQTLYLVPSLDAEKHVVWKCVGDRIPPRYLPLRCRG